MYKEKLIIDCKCKNVEGNNSLDLLGVTKVMNEEIKNNMKGVVWIVPSIIGISFELLPGGIKTCLRIFFTDYNCTVLSPKKLSQEINVDIGLAGASIILSLNNRTCLTWEGTLFHKLIDGRKREIKGGGEIVCFDFLVKRNQKINNTK